MTGERLVAELWCRDAVPAEIRSAQERFVSRLEEASAIEDVTVKRWGSYIYPNEETMPRSDTQRVIAAIRRWADRVGCDLEPAFEIYDGRGMAEGGSRTIIRLPVTCLMVYEGETLRDVTPCTVDGRTYTVADAITAVETDPFHGTHPIADV